MSVQPENLKKEKVRKLSLSELRRLRELSSKTLGKAGSENYRQKLVFDLLNAVRSKDKDRFLWVLLRALNSQVKDNPEAKRLAGLLGEVFLSSGEDFEKVAYSIILGIMAGGES
ncbi:hypothetical protein [Palaeococcus ferrophilus]|uniref:hypothetical protein n=1 Tax=Palaeococcus ferrophilus TaxID=83868 RepID=UPI00064F749F|nr:hypothetical protein [Palaeococcus ferrophilus]